MYDYIGEIRIFGGTYAPRNWALCQGQTMSVNELPELFSIISNIYGGDGINNFKLPDLQGRCPVSPGSHIYRGAFIGTETAAMNYNQLPNHTHSSIINLTGTLRCNDNLADHTSPVGNTLGRFKDNIDVYNSNTPDADMHDHTAVFEGNINVSNAGNGVAHENRQPSLALNYIICVRGLYPERS